jgi:hypothetical protein
MASGFRFNKWLKCMSRVNSATTRILKRIRSSGARPQDAKILKRLQAAYIRCEQTFQHGSYGLRGLAKGCFDEKGFVPVPACMGRHVPGSKRKSCPHGVNKRTGKCLKHPRRK